MTPLVWANIPLMLLFLLAWAGIPLWMVLRRPDKAPDHSHAHSYLRAKADHLRHAEVGAAKPAQVTAMATAAAPTTPRRGSWRLAAPRGSMPARRRPAAGPAGRAADRDRATRRSRSDA